VAVNLYGNAPKYLVVVEMADVTLKTLHEELTELREEITGLKELLIAEPELRPEVVKMISEARQRVKKTYVPHERVKIRAAGRAPEKNLQKNLKLNDAVNYFGKAGSY